MGSLLADPYKHQSWPLEQKERQWKADCEFLSKFLGKSESDITVASQSFIGREEYLLNFIFACRFWDNCLTWQLTKTANSLTGLITIFAIEGIVTKYGVNQKSNAKNRHRVAAFFSQYLSREEKVELLSNYQFSRQFTLGQSRKSQRHLMYRSRLKNPRYRDFDLTICLSGHRCRCVDWLNAQPGATVDRFSRRLATKLYGMRNAIVHNAAPVLFLSAPGMHEGISSIPSISDAFPTDINKFQSYRTDMTVERFTQIAKNGAWVAFTKGSKARRVKYRR